MCGRYALYGNPKRGEDTLPSGFADGYTDRIWNPLSSVKGHYNIAPTQILPVCTQGEEGPGLESMRWGLLPFWAKDAKKAYSTINARAETVRTAPAFRDAWKRDQRCLVPASGWYEWVDEGGAKKQPYFIQAADGQNPIMFAGLFSRWTGPEGNEIATYTIITTEALGEIRRIHHRSPRVLLAGDWQTWLAGTAAEAEAFLEPQQVRLQVHQVGPDVGNPRNQGEQLIAPLNPV
jgi:putative SOS response-associated peptidase YedK